MNILEVLTYVVTMHWSIVSIYTIIGIIGYVAYRTNKNVNKENEAKEVEICIVSKASKDVENVLFNCIEHHSKMFPEYNVNLIVDSNSQLNGRLVEFAKKFANVNYIEVPNDFKIKAIAKGRAIEYFIQKCVKENKWYVFIDDDNLVKDRKFLKEISFYGKLGYAGANGIIYPRMGKSKLTYVADHLRYFDDLTIFRCGTGLAKMPLNGFHGELLIAKGYYLKMIGFDRCTITEDYSFASELTRKTDAKVWQSDTKICILSPNSVKDFIKQRNRWYRGIKSDIFRAPFGIGLFSGIRLIDWKIGIIGSWIAFPLWFYMGLPMWLILFNLIGAGYYYIAYLHGVMKLKGIKDKIIYTMLIPFYSVLETIAPHYNPKTNGFNVIDKN